jgi:hypothetical protein
MKRFDVYFGYVEYKENTDRKKRPVIIIDTDDKRLSSIRTFGVYSYRKWFDSAKGEKMFYEIKDLEIAGLRRRSFVNLSRFSKIETKQLYKYKHFGKLSERDVDGLLAKVNAYDNIQSYRVILDEFLKTLDN